MGHAFTTCLPDEEAFIVTQQFLEKHLTKSYYLSILKNIGPKAIVLYGFKPSASKISNISFKYFCD